MRFNNTGKCVFWNANASVFNLNEGAIALYQKLELHFAMSRGVAISIAERISHRLTQPVWIGHHPNGMLRQITGEGEMLRNGLRSQFCCDGIEYSD